MIRRTFKQFWYSKKLIIASLTTLFSATLTSPAFARTYEFVFGNYTGQQLVELYWRPAAVEEGGWGADFLSVRRNPLPADGLVKLIIDDAAPPLNLTDPNNGDVIYPDDCSFDIRGVFTNGQELEEYGINLCEISSIGFFDFVDTETFYEGGGQEVFITNAANFPLVELVFETVDNEQYFVFGDDFKDKLREELKELPTLPSRETELFLIDLPESECNYKVTSTFWNNLSGRTFETVTESVDFCSDYDEITVSEDRTSVWDFARRDLTVANNTPYRLVTLEISPSFRPELWSSVIQRDFIAPYTETTDIAAAIQLDSSDEQARCFYDIHGVLIANEDASTQITVEQYFVDLCVTDGKLTFREGIVLD